jgi:hypothetical protein
MPVTFCNGVVVLLAGQAGQFDDQSEAGQWDESMAGYGQVLPVMRALPLESLDVPNSPYLSLTP